MVGVCIALSVQERNASFIVWTLHSELYMVIHIIHMVEQGVHWVIFSYAYYIIHISLPPWCGNGALLSLYQFFKIFHVNICYDW